MKQVIFTDLDGTLLDHETYFFNKAKDALDLVEEKKIPLIFCTSKTRAEIEYWQKKIGINDPFISENGGGIFIPKNYFSFDFSYHQKDKKYYVIELGEKYDNLVKIYNELKERYEIISFNDMNEQEIADDSNLSLSQAKLSMKREYDLPIKIINKRQEKQIIEYIKSYNLKLTKGGRYYHLIGDNDKGKAVRILIDLMEKQYGNLYTIGIGDSKNDFPLLDNVNSPYLVMKKDGSYASRKYGLAGGIGPEGWKKVIQIELTK